MLRRTFLKGASLSAVALFMPKGWQYIPSQITAAPTHGGKVFTSRKSGLWSDACTWDRRSVPGPHDDVVLCHHVTVNQEKICAASLTIMSSAHFDASCCGEITILGNVHFDRCEVLVPPKELRFAASKVVEPEYSEKRGKTNG